MHGEKIKNHTHVKKVEHTSKFLFGIYSWTWKTNNHLKNCWNGPIKNKILIFTMLHFLKNIKKNTCRYHYQNLDDMIDNSWDIEQNILNLVILGYFLPPKNTKNKKFWKMKKFAGDIILHMCTKNHNHIIYSSWDTEWDRQNFLSFWARDIILYTYMCTINEDHIMHGSWNTRCNR